MVCVVSVSLTRQMTPRSERLDDLCASFRRDLRAEGRVPRTGVLYALSVRLFSGWLAAHGRPATLDELTRSTIHEWLAELAAETRVASTVWTPVHGVASALRVAGRRRGAIGASDGRDGRPRRRGDPGADLERRRADDAAASVRRPGFASLRDTAMIRVLLDAAVRVSELCGLTVEGIDLDQEMVLVTGKGAKVRPVYFSARTVRALDSPVRTG